MKTRWYRWFALPLAAAVIAGLGMLAFPVQARPVPQAASPSPTLMATVTGTPGGVVITVNSENDQINVRSGPGTTYPKVGVLLAGQQVSARGRSPGGEWVLIDYPGVSDTQTWVYSYNMIIPPGSFLQVVEIPPTPTPATTATLDPTLASQFLITVAPSRMPTFTPAPPLVIPTTSAQSGSQIPGGVPMGLVIIVLGALGVFLGLVSLIRGR